MNALTVQQAYPWVIFQTYSIYTMGIGVLLVSTIILRPNLARKRLVSWTLAFLIVFPLILILLDISGASSVLLDQPLLLSTAEFEKTYTGGYLSVDNYVVGIFAPVFELQLLGSFIFALIYPLLTVAILDRKTNPENSRAALILFVSTLIVAPPMVILINVLPPTVPPLIANFFLTAGFAYIGIQRTQAQLGITGLRKLIGDFPMFNKLLMTSIGIILPSILFVGFSSFSFYQQTVLNIYNNDLTTLAKTQGDLINQEIESLLSSLNQVADYYLTQFYLDDRYEYLAEIPLNEIPVIIQQEELEWQSEGSVIKESVTRVGKIIPLDLFQQNNPIFKSLFLTDKYGAVISATEAPENYNQSQFQWWRWVLITRQAFIGTPVWDEVAGENLVEIAVPVLSSSDPKTIEGVLYSLYSIQSIQEDLSKSTENQIITFELTSKENEPFSSQDVLENKDISAILGLISEDTEKDWHVIQYNDENNIVVLDDIEHDRSKNNLSWKILALAPVDEALAPVFIARTGIYILMAFMLAGSIGMTIVIAGLITTPLRELTQTAERIAAGEKDIKSEVTGADEIGTLASTFNRMTQEMSHLVDNLEQTVQERTRALENRAVQMEASALVAREAAEIQDHQELLTRVVHLVSDRLGFYHTGVFLIDERGEYAVLQAANSEGGQKMLARGHKLQVGKVGVVGYTAGSGEPRIAQDVGADVIYYDNPDMPNTRSELSLPLAVRGNVIGVLDVQSTHANAFRREDLEILQILADQIAVAIDNARLFQASQNAIVELERLYGQQATQAWKQQLTKQDIIYSYNPVGVGIRQEEIDQKIIGELDDIPSKKLSKEITFRGQVIGTIDLLRELDQENWSEDEEILVEEILEQTALALENARLLDQIRLRSDQIHLLQEITALSSTLLSEEDLLQSISQKLHTGLELLECSVILFDENHNYASLVSKSNATNTHPAIGSMLALEADSVSREMKKRKKTLILYNVKNDPSATAYNQAFSPPNTYTTVLLPLIARDEVIGMLNLETDDPNREIDNEDMNLFEQIGNQVSTALESSRLFSAEQQGRQAAAAMLEISQISSSSLDIQQVLFEATQKSAEAVQAYRCTIFMVDQDSNTIRALMSRFADPQLIDMEMWEKLKTMGTSDVENLPIIKRVLEHRQVEVIDVSEHSDAITRKWFETFGITKLLALPLISVDRIIGLLFFDHVDEEKHFTTEQIELAQTIAGQIASTIENANLFNQALRRAERERHVAEITSKIRTSNDPKVILHTALNELRQALKKSKARIMEQSDGE
jgi:GAF domain-containing protein/HAMP domain-containing protein